MGKVYLVSEGMNEIDYYVRGVYSKPEPAEEHKKRGGDDFQAEEWSVDEPIPEKGIGVYLSQEGKGPAIQGLYRSFGFQGFNSLGTLEWVVKTEDRELARILVKEKCLEILKLGIWGNDKKVKEHYA